MKNIINKTVTATLMVFVFVSCSSKKQSADTSEVKVVPVNPEYFIKESLLNNITKETRDINGTEMPVYVITAYSQPTEHDMGPWCPETIEDGEDKGGIWFEDGKVYDVDGQFIATLDEFYNDDTWKLYREDGSVIATRTQKACEAAARPDVDEAYHNHCVECSPGYYQEKVTTYVIPATPVYTKKPKQLRQNGVGLAFNGVNFDPPAPVHAILAAHTIAPLDDHGGHVNPHAGYHYHAATGSTKEIDQTDGHAPMIGYAMDGFGIFALSNNEGEEPTDLDECRGHEDQTRGYHYHAGEPGSNQVLGCLRGKAGYMEVEE